MTAEARPRASWTARILAALGLAIVLIFGSVAAVTAQGAAREFDVTGSTELPTPNRIVLELGTSSQLTVQSGDDIARPSFEVFGTFPDGDAPFRVDTSEEGTVRITSAEQASLPWRSDANATASAVLLLPSSVAANVEVVATASSDAYLSLSTAAARVDVTASGAAYVGVDGNVGALQLTGPETSFWVRGEFGTVDVTAATFDVNFANVTPERATIDTSYLSIAGLPTAAPLAVAGPAWLEAALVGHGYTVNADAAHALDVNESLSQDSFAWGDELW